MSGNVGAARSPRPLVTGVAQDQATPGPKHLNQSRVPITTSLHKPWFPLQIRAVEALLDPRLTDRQRRICLWVILRSWGRIPGPSAQKAGRREDWTEPTSLRAVARELGIDQSDVSKAVRDLVNAGILLCEYVRHKVRLQFNEHRERWTGMGSPGEGETPSLGQGTLMRAKRPSRRGQSALTGVGKSPSQTSPETSRGGDSSPSKQYLEENDSLLTEGAGGPPAPKPRFPKRFSAEESPPLATDYIQAEALPRLVREGPSVDGSLDPVEEGRASPAGRRKRTDPDPRVNEVRCIIEEEYHRRGKPTGWSFERDGSLARRALRELDRMGDPDPVGTIRLAIVEFLDHDGRAEGYGHQINWFWARWASYVSRAKRREGERRLECWDEQVRRMRESGVI